MATRESCKYCGTFLMVPLDVQYIDCPVCQTTSCVARKIKSYDLPKVGNHYYGGHYEEHTELTPYASHYYQPPVHSYVMHHRNRYQQPVKVSMQLPPPQVHGRKRAVLCGITYQGHPKQLEASVNNVRCMKYLLGIRLGFPEASTIVLTEEESNPSRIPTKHNIQTALRWLIHNCQSGDSLVFYYSGHGSRLQDIDGDELDGYDESLCPVDYKTAGKLLDDEINATIVRPLPRGAKLHSIIDTCFSGTVLDLPYLCRMNQAGYYNWEVHHTIAYKGTSGGRAFCFSACDDNQNSGDTTAFTGNAVGALTYGFIHALENERKFTYGSLLLLMRNKVHEAQKLLGVNAPFASSASQEPQLSSSDQFDIYAEHFFL